MAGRIQEQPQEQQPPEVYQAQEPRKIIINDTIDTPEQAAATSTAEKVDSLVKSANEKQGELIQAYMQAIKTNIPRVEESVKQSISTMEEIGKSMLQSISDRIKPENSYQELLDRLIPAETRKAIADTVNMIREYQAKTFISDNTEEALRIMALLTPYIDEELDERPELYKEKEDKSNPAVNLIVTAARRAREDGKEIPLLKVEEPRNKRAAAASEGALITIGERLLVPSDPEFQNAFASRVRADIGVFVIETLTDLKLLDNGMQLSFLDNGISDLTDANKRTGAKPLKDADTGFLRAMAKAAYRTRIYSDSISTKFFLPAFCDEIGITGEHGKETGSRAKAREREIIGRIEEMRNVWGKLPGSSQWWRVFTILGYDPISEIVTVAMPYFNQLLTAIEQKQKRELAAGKEYYIGYCDLLHSSAANERNQAAVELAARVLIGVQQRGCKPDAELKQNRHKNIKDKTVCSWHISCAGLIDSCPQMQEKLDTQQTTGGRNKTMQRAFMTMYRVLKEKSDLFTYYNNVSMVEIVPTTKTIAAEIIIKHHGLNTNYKRPITAFDEMQEEDPEQTEETTQETAQEPMKKE